MIELTQDFDVHPNQIKQWRDHLLEGVTGVFGEALKADTEPVIDVKTLHAKIGELMLEGDFLYGALGKAGQDLQNVISVAMLSEGWDAKNVTHTAAGYLGTLAHELTY
ncbi:hypothetical protein P775_20195 [Puniceibacterium antarcticum]|uniref:Transposase n=1 Tax=Puniceibacterium antarcticum TaxID=1206336 RepID=A0A2G8R9W4_9RHOB|nr:hypothetical protein P775_20195 [Puniceibacterium antarcticum]